MSRTTHENHNRILLLKPHKGKRGIVGTKFLFSKRKMKPMLGGDRYNYGKLVCDTGVEVPYCYRTKTLKLELKNANRSAKKKERQKSKSEIRSILEN
jgi:hypothetical protein